MQHIWKLSAETLIQIRKLEQIYEKYVIDKTESLDRSYLTSLGELTSILLSLTLTQFHSTVNAEQVELSVHSHTGCSVMIDSVVSWGDSISHWLNRAALVHFLLSSLRKGATLNTSTFISEWSSSTVRGE